MTGTRGLIGVLAIVAWSAPALAQPTPPRDPIAAEALFERGKELVERGQTAEACTAFAESQRLDPAGGTLLRLAMCHETQGRLASAWLEFLEVVRVSKEGTGEPAKLAERVRIAQQHLATIEPRVPKLTVTVPAASRVAGLAVTANGLPRNEGAWGVALPVDPGDVEILATAPGRQPFRAVVHVDEGRQVTVDVPALPETATTATTTTTPVPPPVPPPADTNETSPLRPIGIVVGAVGVVAIGVGSYFGARAISKWNDSNSLCPGTTGCSPSAVSLANDAKQAALIADVTIAAGAVALAAGIVLYVIGAPKSVQARAAGVAISF
jgi:hypothetical protein